MNISLFFRSFSWALWCQSCWGLRHGQHLLLRRTNQQNEVKATAWPSVNFTRHLLHSWKSWSVISWKIHIRTSLISSLVRAHLQHLWCDSDFSRFQDNHLCSCTTCTLFFISGYDSLIQFTAFVYNFLYSKRIQLHISHSSPVLYLFIPVNTF